MPSVPKQVKGFLVTQPDDRIGIVLNWSANQEIDIDHYNIFRGGAGILSNAINPSVNITNGDTLQVIINGGKTQTIIFSNTYITDGAATAPEIVNNINAQLVGGQALLARTPIDPTVLIRSNNSKKSGSVEITGGNANIVLGFPSGIFRNSRLSSFQKIGEVLQTTQPSFLDLDGKPEEFYYVEAETTTPLIGQKSKISSLGKYVDEIPDRIFISGNIYKADGSPLVGAKIILKPLLESRPSVNFPPEMFGSIEEAEFGISFQEVVVNTDEDGFFEMLAIANTRLQLYIPAIEYDLSIKTGSQNVNFLDSGIIEWRLI